ncbi:MAG: hypothetical protein ABI366_02210 [Ginsengibacter sp.]
MENIYNAYTKEINGKTFYFVKKFSVYPEVKDCTPVLETMGMHTNFFKACNLAFISEKEIINQLKNDLHIVTESARIIHPQKVKSMTHSLVKNTQHAILKLRLASIN